MLTLHATYIPGTDNLLFFGEDPECQMPGKRGRKSKKISSIPHPYPLTHDQLHAILSGMNVQPEGPPEDTAQITFPTYKNRPIGSHDQVSGETGWGVFSVPVVRVRMRDLPILLPSLTGSNSDGFSPGDSCIFFKQTCGLTLELMMRGLFIPNNPGIGEDYSYERPKCHIKHPGPPKIL